MGYLKQTFRYYFYQPSEQKVFVAKRVVFLEKQYFLQEDSKNQIDLKKNSEIQINDSSLDEPSGQAI